MRIDSSLGGFSFFPQQQSALGSLRKISLVKRDKELVLYHSTCIDLLHNIFTGLWTFAKLRMGSKHIRKRAGMCA